MNPQEQPGFRTKIAKMLATAALAALTAMIGMPPLASAWQEPPPAPPAEPTPATEPAAEPTMPTTAPTVTDDQPSPATQPATEPSAAAQPATEPSAAAQPSLPPEPAPEELSPEERAAREALAERFASLSKLVMRSPKILPIMLRENKLLLKAAVRSDPHNVRLHRLLIESCLQSRDNEGAKQALTAYIKLLGSQGTGDDVAAAMLIDLHASDMQTAEKKVEYLKGIADAEGLGQEIRSHAALRLAQVYIDRGQNAEADDAITQAVKLNPLNAAAQRARYERRRDDAAPAQRMMMLLAMLRANPAQPDVVAQVAHELSDVGIVDAAIEWYGMSFTLSQQMGRGIGTAEDFTDYTAELLAAGQPRDASANTNKLLETDPGNADAAFVKLLSERRLGDPEHVTAAKQSASDAVSRRLTDLHARLTQQPPPAAGEAPATQPLDAVADQVLADVQKLKEGGVDPALYSAYVAGLARAAWFEIYFNETPQVAAKFIDALRTLLPEGDVVVARLEGWSFLAEGKTDEAKVKLSAVADGDPLSKLGMIRLAEKDAGKDATTSELQKLAGENASGVTGAILIEALRDRDARLVPAPAAAEVRAELEKFPKAFMGILDMRGVTSFYKVTAEPLKVSHKLCEPMLARVTVQNISDYDISLGVDGTLKPDLWFGAKLQGVASQSLATVGYDRMGQLMVLKAKSGTVSQVVRLDDGEVGPILMGNPIPAVSLMFNVFTNPVPVETGIAPGPGGQRVQFTRVVDRAGSPVAAPQHVQALIAPIQMGTAAERIRAAEVLGAFVAWLQSDNAPAEMKQLTGLMYTSLERAAAGNDASPTSRAFIDFTFAHVTTNEQRLRIVEHMLKRDSWVDRTLGLCLVLSLPRDAQKPLASNLAESDPDPLVRQFAATVLDAGEIMAQQAASTQPTGPLSPEPGAPATPGTFEPGKPSTPGTGGFDLNPSTPPPPPSPAPGTGG